MPVSKRVRKVVNPRRRTSTGTTARRRKMTKKQIRFFGTKRQKAALKAGRARKRRGTARTSTPRSGRKNPALVLTLGAVNPKRRKTMAASRKRKTTRRRRRNPAGRSARTGRFTRRTTARRRTTSRRRNAPKRRRRIYARNANPRRRVYRRRRRRNPTLFGMNIGGTKMAQGILGGLLGVAAAKFIPTVIPIRLGGGNVIRTILSGVSAFIAAAAASRFVGPSFGNYVLFGGLMQTGSVALNAFLPALGGYLALSGLGELVPTSGFAVPQNPMIAAPVAAPAGQNGLDRAFGRAF